MMTIDDMELSPSGTPEPGEGLAVDSDREWLPGGLFFRRAYAWPLNAWRSPALHRLACPGHDDVRGNRDGALVLWMPKRKAIPSRHAGDEEDLVEDMLEEMDLDVMVPVVLSETDTMTLIEMRPALVQSEGAEADAVRAQNERYELLLEEKRSSDRFVHAQAQTLDNLLRSQHCQSQRMAFSEAQVQAFSYEIEDEIWAANREDDSSGAEDGPQTLKLVVRPGGGRWVGLCSPGRVAPWRAAVACAGRERLGLTGGPLPPTAVSQAGTARRGRQGGGGDERGAEEVRPGGEHDGEHDGEHGWTREHVREHDEHDGQAAPEEEGVPGHHDIRPRGERLRTARPRRSLRGGEESSTEVRM